MFDLAYIIAAFDSPYFDVVESYTLFYFPTCNSCNLT